MLFYFSFRLSGVYVNQRSSHEVEKQNKPLPGQIIDINLNRLLIHASFHDIQKFGFIQIKYNNYLLIRIKKLID